MFLIVLVQRFVKPTLRKATNSFICIINSYSYLSEIRYESSLHNIHGLIWFLSKLTDYKAYFLYAISIQYGARGSLVG
jgi:hypothetical protein